MKTVKWYFSKDEGSGEPFLDSDDEHGMNNPSEGTQVRQALGPPSKRLSSLWAAACILLQSCIILLLVTYIIKNWEVSDSACARQLSPYCKSSMRTSET